MPSKIRLANILTVTQFVEIIINTLLSISRFTPVHVTFGYVLVVKKRLQISKIR